ncbi:MAG TPA: recombinase family protein [Planctomycetaceae bacterium]|jgi:DNA invertase Pin-like site-specific DNA recombinase|nr:recombinase family protein [Planctomycetaceae bacterium]
MVRSPFLDFIRLVVDDEVDNVSRRLRTNPALATTAASAGATRQEAASCFFKQISSLAQFERRLIQERTKAGLAAARARGRTGANRVIKERFNGNRSESARVVLDTLTRQLGYSLAPPDGPKPN